MAIDLDVNNPNQVVSATSLDVQLGGPTQSLVIFAGIALPVKRSEDNNLERDLVRVNLRRRATTLIAYTATIGLASIFNEDSDLVFATDDVSVAIDENSDLQLLAHIGVQGDSSILHRFSYQAHVVIEVDEPLIAGSIRWSRDVFTANRQTHLFDVTAFVHIDDGTLTGKNIDIESVENSGTPTANGDLLEVPYALRNPPLNTPLRLRVEAAPGAFSTASDGTIAIVQTSGPDPITLTTNHLKEVPVDFLMRLVPPPR